MKRILFGLVVLLLFGILNTQLAYSATDYSISHNGDSYYTLSWDSSVTPSYEIQCQNSLYNCQCDTAVTNQDTGESVQSRYIEIENGDAEIISLPSYNSGSKPQRDSEDWKLTTSCYDSLDSTRVEKQLYYTFSWPTDTEWNQYQQEQQEKSQAESDISTASSLISSAQSAINNAQNKIREVNQKGADIGSAQRYLDQAESDISSANSYLSNARNALNAQNYQSASNYASQAQSKANSAKSNAQRALSQATSIIEEWNRKKTQAQNRVSDANSAIDTAKQRIQHGEDVIENATVVGLDTAQAKADIATARSKVKTVEDYYSEASNLFDSNNFDGAKSKARSAVNLADEADQLATQAYNSLEKEMTVAGESSKAILEANSEVSKMNEIMTKMTFIVRNMEDQGVKLNSTKSVFENAKSSVNSAEDLLSKAKNRQSSGQFEASANMAIQARDSAASARNRLDTITQEFSFNVQDSLEKALKEKKQIIQAAEEELSSAQQTYGADAEDIVEGQNKLKEAKASVEEAGSVVTQVKAASGLRETVDTAEEAFKELENAEENAVKSVSFSKAAKRALLEKIAAIGAGVIAIGGGGFLYYRKRRKKKGKKKSEKKVSRSELESMTKDEIKEYADENHGIELSTNNRKDEMIDQFLKEFESESSGKGLTDKLRNVGIGISLEKGEKTEETEETEEDSDSSALEYCPQCGEELTENARFCHSCGEEIGG